MSTLRVASILFFLAAAAAFTQDAAPARFGEQAFVTAIELAVRVTDADGRTPDDLQTSDFVVFEDGVERPVIGVDYLGAPGSDERQRWDVVVWIDATTTSQSTLRTTSAELASRAADLVAIGPVTLVWGNPAPEVLVASSTDAGEIRTALERLGQRSPRDEIRRIRMRALGASDDFVPFRGAVDRRATRVTGEILSAVREEAQIIRQARHQIGAWLSRLPGEPPRALLLVGDGFDLDPSEFYLEYLRSIEGADADRYEPQLRPFRQDEAHEKFARALAVRGWTVIGVGGSSAAEFPDDAARAGGRRVTDFLGSNPGAARPTTLTLHPRDAFLALADATGGSLVPRAGKLGDALDDLRNRVVLTYQVPRAPDAEPRRVEVRALRDELEVTAPRWASSSPPAALAEARAAALLESDASVGELPVSLETRLGDANARGTRSGEITTRVDLGSLANVADRLGSTRVRVTVAVGGDDALPVVVQAVLDADLAARRGLQWSAPLEVEAGKTRVAVVVEELTTGAWGGAVAPLSSGIGARPLGPDPRDLPGSWLVATEDAFAVARAEEKPVLGLALHRSCGACPARVREALMHPAIERRAASFVRLLIDSESGSGASSYFAVFDPDGREHFRLPLERSGRPIATAELSEFLGRVQDIAPLLIEGAALAREGKLLPSKRAFGLAYRRAGDLQRAIASFDHVRELALAGGDVVTAQTAEVLLGLTRLQGGDFDRALGHFEAVVRNPASPGNHAEALLGIGQVRRARGNEKGAIDAFVEAARLAPEGSEVRQAAMTLAGAASDVVHGAVSLTAEHSIKPLQLVIAGRPPFRGRVSVQGLVHDPRIDRVTFLLDDEEVATDDTPPFTAAVDLGPIPRSRKLRIAAFGPGGELVAEDLVIVNERHDQFWAELAVEGTRAHLEATQPLGRRLERVDFFLDGRLLRSLSASPWQIEIPESGETSVLRAVARLDDGTLAEDAVLLNAGGYTADVEVHEVELYVTATHRGEPVSDLTLSEFTVTENGKGQTIHGFEFRDGAPWTAGIAMDSSGSMTAVLPDVQEAARDFAARTIENGGRAFLVDFDGTPRLAHPTSADLGSVGAAIDRITAGGGTALYDAIVFGLLQLQGIDGKRALIVLTDGEDRNSRYDYQDAIRVAQESGATVYALLIDEHSSMYATNISRLRRELETLARVTGGEAWYLQSRRGIAEVYDAIDRELRNQYVLTYRTAPASKPDEWRDVDVRVSRKGVQVKAIDGYFVK